MRPGVTWKFISIATLITYIRFSFGATLASLWLTIGVFLAVGGLLFGQIRLICMGINYIDTLQEFDTQRDNKNQGWGNFALVFGDENCIRWFLVPRYREIKGALSSSKV